MATATKVLAQIAPSATTSTVLYTVPASTSTVVSTIVACNRTSAQAKVRVAVRPAGVALDPKHYILFDFPLKGLNSWFGTVGLTLAATDVISVYTDLANVSFSLFGEEVS